MKKFLNNQTILMYRSNENKEKFYKGIELIQENNLSFFNSKSGYKKYLKNYLLTDNLDGVLRLQFKPQWELDIVVKDEVLTLFHATFDL